MTLTSSKKERSVSDPSRDSLEKLVRKDFLSIFEACAQERTCEKPVKTNGFLRFFVGRHFFERTDALERKTIEKSSKSTLWGGSQIDPRATKIHPRATKIHPRATKIAPRSIGIAQDSPKKHARQAKSDQEAPKSVTRSAQERQGRPKSRKGTPVS